MIDFDGIWERTINAEGEFIAFTGGGIYIRFFSRKDFFRAKDSALQRLATRIEYIDGICLIV